MNRYILIIILIVLYAGLKRGTASDSSKRKRLIKYFSFFLILDSGLRNIAVGSDTYQYYMIFESVKSITLADLMRDWISPLGYVKDPFYRVFIKLFQVFLPHYRFFLIFVAIFFFWTLGKFLYKNVNSIEKTLVSYVFYIALYYGFFSVTGIRQCLSVGLVMLAWNLIQKRRIVFAVILTAIAAQFHTTAWVFLLALPIPFISLKQFVRFILPLSAVLVVFIYVFRDSIAAYMVVTTGMEERFGGYLSETNTRFSIAIFGMYLLVFLSIFMSKGRLLQDERMKSYCMMYIIAFMLLATALMDNSAIRIALYFTTSLYVLVPELIGSLRIGNKYTIAVVLMMIVMIPSIKDNSYGFFWQKMQVPEEYGTFYIQENTLFD